MHTINKNRHSAFLLHVHIVFVTKYRRKILCDLHIERLRQIFAEVGNEFEASLEECNGEADHIHMLFSYTPKVQLTKLVNSLKAVSSRRMRNEFTDIRGAYSKPVLWSRSYFVGSCGGAPLDTIKQYIENQKG
jgi:putative transposase